MMTKQQNLYQHIENAIIEGTLRSGSRLPSERKLAEDFELSRPSVREVLQGIKAKGWIISKQGGGHYVSNQLQQEISEPLIKILAQNPDAQFDLLEFRRNIEGDCAYYAALRSNEVDIQSLKVTYNNLQLAYQNRNIEQESKADAEFHLMIAEISHNLIYLHIVKSLFDVLRNNMRSSIETMFDSNITREMLMRQHTAIYEGITSHNPTAAKEAALDHINYVEKTLQNLEREEYRRRRSEKRNNNEL